MNKEGNLQTYGFDSLMWMFGVNPPSAIDVKDNEPVFLFTDPKMKEALAYIHKNDGSQGCRSGLGDDEYA
ncbi:hypothetical protein ACFSQ7_25760 [Paenibacillus rhizoplanae]